MQVYRKEPAHIRAELAKQDFVYLRDRIPVGIVIQGFATLPFTVRIVVEDFSLSENAWILMSNEIALQLLPHLGFDFRVAGVVGEVVDAVRIVQYIVELLKGAFAKIYL